MIAAPDAAYPAGALEVSWGDPPVSTDPGCAGMTFTLDHFLILTRDDAWPTGPGDVNARAWAINDKKARGARLTVHRAQRTFYAKVYACDDASPGCADHFGADTGEALSDTAANADTAVTAQEIWRLVGVDADTDDYMFDTPGFTAPSPFFFDDDWCPASAGRLAVYYSRQGRIYRAVESSADTGWRNYNDQTAITWDIDPVAQVHRSDPDFVNVSHPYAAQVLDSAEDVYIQINAQNRTESCATSGVCHIVSVRSTDGCGTDFDLGCADCCPDGADLDTAPDSGLCDWPGAGEVIIPLDTGVALLEAQHGTWVWDYIANPGLDLGESQDMVLLFSGTSVGTCATGNGTYRADWDSVDGWHLATDGPPTCPVEQIDNRHNASAIPLPGGDRKVYVLSYNMATDPYVYTYYWNGTFEEWEDHTAIPRFVLDDADTGATEISPECLGGPHVFARIVGGVPYEGAIVQVEEVDPDTASEKPCSGDRVGAPQFAWYFAELQNHMGGP